METTKHAHLFVTQQSAPKPPRHTTELQHAVLGSLLGSLFLAAALPAAAQSPIGAQNMVVTATRTAKSVNEVLAQVTVITRLDIDEAGAPSLVDLLQRRANIDIRATGGPGQTSSVFIRGTNATHTLVLVDGQRVASSTSGATAFENIPLDLIDRIEVVRGPMSSLYGSEAIGGVIQIFTRKGGNRAADKDTKLTASAGIGSFSARQAEASIEGLLGETRMLLTASRRTIDAPSATNPLAGSFTFNPDRDAYENTGAAFKLTHQLWQGEILSFSAWQSRGKTRFDSGPGNNAESTQTLRGAQLASDNNFADWWKSRLTIGSTSDDSIVASNFPSKFKTTQDQFVWQNQLATPAGDALLGFERRNEKVAATTNYTSKTRTTDSVFGSISQKVGEQTLTVNARHDKEDQFGSRSTGGVSWGYQLWKDELVYLSAGRAFRAPSFNDLYFPGFSNPVLRPEKSESGEFGWRLTRKAFQLNLAVFENKIEDLIAFDSATSRPQNIRRARIRGWELGVDTNWAGIDWRTRITAQRPEDADTNKRLRSRAKLLGTLGGSTTIGAWKLGSDLTMSGARFDSANEAPTSRMSGYALWSAFARYRIDPEWSVDITGSNLTNRKYELARGYNTLGRQLQITLRFTGK
ncbi:MAG: TonB-dependent receptor [Rhodocyclaceae bacterium]|nr:TonB-dependent receptor [Rhodocyclaceae bacterium]MCA3020121.1 TonB-dependent receptor [Rhodocyclaceae bacterium]MCA3021752.1 TonB-dependent receptor [Rhodocyclaceae bacterium]MCA3023972.1 TonB-dependent receptor [Rhodocyclaceae bacterium]MCA3027806.1 TonB-dependent receptor [Rhodocyclaceae bacterium]